jgi:hypothetical protein
LGLLFLIVGREGHDHKLVLSRFPADSAILADEVRQALTVRFLERVFMKSATAYKAASYRDGSLAAGFWSGRAIDKQINSPVVQLSNYWIAEFLASDFRATAAAGTRRLALALRAAARSSDDIGVKSELAAAVTLAGGFRGRRMNIRQFAEHLGLSDAARDALSQQVHPAGLLDEQFQFDGDEFRNQVGYRSVELDSGVMLTAESATFDDVIEKRVINERERRVRYSAEGRVISESLGKSK